MLIIGFGSKARMGKDTAANAILKYYTRKNDLAQSIRIKTVNVGIFKYATGLYQEVNDWLKVTTENGKIDYATDASYAIPASPTNKIHVQLPDWVKPDPNPEKSELAPYGKHPKLLQFWGTDFRRAQDPDYWVKKLFQSIPTNLDIVLITDVRFQNEADAIKQRGGYLVNIQRLNKDGEQYVALDRPANHPSETALDKYNWDFRLQIPEGHTGLLGEWAITLAEYLRGLQK